METDYAVETELANYLREVGFKSCEIMDVPACKRSASRSCSAGSNGSARFFAHANLN